MSSDVEVMDRGMACLIDGLRAIDTERFEVAVAYNEARPFRK